MTKYEYLKFAGTLESIYTWKALGSCEAKADTKIYNEDSIYLVNSPQSQSLHKCLVYCKKGYVGNDLPWYKAEVVDSEYGEISFENKIISPNFAFLLSREEFESVNQSLPTFIRGYEDFVPFSKLNDSGSVIISNEDYERCLTCLGFPFITEDELEYTREEIMNLAIKPALEEYFHWIPSAFPTEHDAMGDCFEIDMPTEAYGVVGISLQQIGTGSSNSYISPMYYAMEQSLFSGFTGNTGLGYNGSRISSLGMRNSSALTSSLQNRAAAQALVNYTRRVHYEGPYTRPNGSRYIKVYSNTSGRFNIWWAKRTLNFNDVEYAHRTRVFEYAQANIKELFGNLRRQSKADVPGSMDYSKWLEEAHSVKERITGEYKALVKGSGIIRGSLG